MEKSNECQNMSDIGDEIDLIDMGWGLVGGFCCSKN